MDGEETTTKRGRGGRGRSTRGAGRPKGRGRGRGRGRKASKVIESDEESSQEQPEQEGLEVSTEEKPTEETNIVAALIPMTSDEKENEVHAPTIDMEADISQLEAPTFTTISRGPPEPMVRLKWDHKVSLIGEKVMNPMIHCCDQCEKPILIYGRMIPCKHVFCLRCARSEPIKICPRCKDKVIRVEQSGLGTVFMCTHGGSRYGNTGCRRTYLSQRDLQAHINHRHVTQNVENKVVDPKLSVSQRKVSLSNDSSVMRQSSAPRAGQTTANVISSASGRGVLMSEQIQITSSVPNTSLMHHHQPSRTMAQELNSYFSPSDTQYGQATSYATITSQQSFVSGALNLSQPSVIHNLPTPTSAAPFYASYAQYTPMQTPPQNVHYSNANVYSTASAIQASISQQTIQTQSTSQSQSTWTQQSYYR